jgi:hypothetical protein
MAVAAASLEVLDVRLLRITNLPPHTLAGVHLAHPEHFNELAGGRLDEGVAVVLRREASNATVWAWRSDGGKR